MLEISDKAIQYLKKMLAREQAKVFRLSVKQTGCSGWMYLPEIIQAANETDILVSDKADFSVYVKADSLSALQGTKIDLVSKSLGQEVLVYENPNANSLCGCGESFNLKS